MQHSYILYRGRCNHVMTLYDVIRQLMSGFDLNVVSASISPLQNVRELHALSPSSLVLITLLINVTVVKPCIGFCTGLLHSYITGGLGSLTMIMSERAKRASSVPVHVN